MPAPSKINAAIKAEKKAEAAAPVLPKNWPEDITFLTDLTYSTAVTAETRRGLSRDPVANSPWTKISAEILAAPSAGEIQIISDEKHPACGQRGLFAAQNLVPDSFICIYLGHVHMNTMSDTDPHSDYDLSLDRELDLSVDGARSGNVARFTNDYRGIADRPNAEFRDCFIQVPSQRSDGTKWERRVGIFVLGAGKAGLRKNGIKAGQEVLISYGKSYWESRRTIAKFRKNEEMYRIASAALDA